MGECREGGKEGREDERKDGKKAGRSDSLRIRSLYVDVWEVYVVAACMSLSVVTQRILVSVVLPSKHT